MQTSSLPVIHPLEHVAIGDELINAQPFALNVTANGLGRPKFIRQKIVPHGRCGPRSPLLRTTMRVYVRDVMDRREVPSIGSLCIIEMLTRGGYSFFTNFHHQFLE